MVLKTTVGRVIFNEALPRQLVYKNVVMDKGKLRDVIGRRFTPDGTWARFVWYEARDDWGQLLDVAVRQLGTALEERLGERFEAWQAREREEDEDEVATIKVPRRRERLSA